MKKGCFEKKKKILQSVASIDISLFDKQKVYSILLLKFHL